MTISILDGFEKQLEGWYKNIPNLPKNFSEWIAKYSWIFVLVGAVLTGFAALGLLTTLGLFTAVSTTYGVYYGATSYVLFGWIALVALIVYPVFSIMAISPLKAMKRDGWKILYYLEFSYLVFGILKWLTTPAYVSSLFGTVIGIAIGFYFLFQVKEYFK